MTSQLWTNTADGRAALDALDASGRLSARGATLQPDDVKQILQHAPRVEDCASLATADFYGASFPKGGTFNRVRFGHANFGSTTFGGPANFEETVFNGDAWFGEATFTAPVGFPLVTFNGEAGFYGAEFMTGAVFSKSRFRRLASFGGRVQTSGDESGAQFHGRAVFTECEFAAQAEFAGARFADVDFSESVFLEALDLGLHPVQGCIRLNSCRFEKHVRLELHGQEVQLTWTEFRRGATIEIATRQLYCRSVDFGTASTLSPAALAPRTREANKAEDHRAESALGELKVLSLSRARLGSLLLSGADLRACRFSGAHQLDGLRIESNTFPKTPCGHWWMSRRALAEEHQWRYETYDAALSLATGRLPNAGQFERYMLRTRISQLESRRRGWYPPESRPPADHRPTPPVLEPAAIADLYRSLRKGLEDRKDEPGAADFYYGEMEMRRMASRQRGEHFILWLYWLLSGYGLRASRSLVALVVVIVAFSALFLTVGLEDPGAHTAMLRTVEAATFRGGSTSGLTTTGAYLQIAVRLLGPLFFGLTILSLRGRLKR